MRQDDISWCASGSYDELSDSLHNLLSTTAPTHTTFPRMHISWKIRVSAPSEVTPYPSMSEVFLINGVAYFPYKVPLLCMI